MPVFARQVEDIVDTGRTLKSLINSIQQQGAASVKIATLLNKQARRVVDVQADYVGFEVCCLPVHAALHQSAYICSSLFCYHQITEAPTAETS